MTSGRARPRNRRLPISRRAVALAVLLHAVLFGIMFIKVDSHVKQVAVVKALQIKVEKPQDIIEATAIDNKVLEKKKEKKRAIEREKKRKVAVEKKRKLEKEKKRKAETKRKKKEQLKKKEAEKKRSKELAIKKAEEKKKADARKKKAAEEKKKVDKEKARKKAEAKKKKEAERKKKLADEKKRKVAAEKKRKAEAKRKREDKLMKEQMAKRAREARASQALSKYVPRIQRKVEDNWRLPPQGASGCNPTVRVDLAPSGKVLNARIVKSSGDPYCDSSVEKAFLKASPIPIPLDPDLYSEFKTIDFPFRP